MSETDPVLAGLAGRDLLSESARGTNLDQLVGIVTTAPASRHTPRLPALPDLPLQPTGFEEGYREPHPDPSPHRPVR